MHYSTCMKLESVIEPHLKNKVSIPIEAIYVYPPGSFYANNHTNDTSVISADVQKWHVIGERSHAKFLEWHSKEEMEGCCYWDWIGRLYWIGSINVRIIKGLFYTLYAVLIENNLFVTKSLHIPISAKNVLAFNVAKRACILSHHHISCSSKSKIPCKHCRFLRGRFLTNGQTYISTLPHTRKGDLFF